MSDCIKVDSNDNFQSVLLVFASRKSHENLLDSFYNFWPGTAGIFGWFSMEFLAKIGHFMSIDINI
jgi:hypothetical protein